MDDNIRKFAADFGRTQTAQESLSSVEGNNRVDRRPVGRYTENVFRAGNRLGFTMKKGDVVEFTPQWTQCIGILVRPCGFAEGDHTTMWEIMSEDNAVWRQDTDDIHPTGMNVFDLIKTGVPT